MILCTYSIKIPTPSGGKDSGELQPFEDGMSPRHHARTLDYSQKIPGHTHKITHFSGVVHTFLLSFREALTPNA